MVNSMLFLNHAISNCAMLLMLHLVTKCMEPKCQPHLLWLITWAIPGTTSPNGKIPYCTAGNFGDIFNLVIWRIW